MLTIEKAIALLNDAKTRNLKILLLATGGRDAYELAAGSTEIKSVNFGGIRMKDGAMLISFVGLVLGDVTQGVIIGATRELIFMGNIKVGAAIPPDVITGGVLGTALVGSAIHVFA